MNTGLTPQLKTGCLLLASLTAAHICQAALTLPTDGLTTQFVADTGVTLLPGGSSVDQWTDQQANGATPVLQSGATPPIQGSETFGSGSHQVIQFSGALNNFLTSTALIDSSALVGSDQGQVFMVLRQNVVAPAMLGSTPLGWGGGSDRLFAQTAWTPDPGVHFQFGNPNGGGDFQVPGGTAAVANNQWHILSLVRNGDYGAVRLDGTVLQESPTAFSSSSTVSGSASLLIGGTGFNDDNFQGAIAEVLVYNNGTLDTQSVESYLGEKYGLAPVPEPSQYAFVWLGLHRGSTGGSPSQASDGRLTA